MDFSPLLTLVQIVSAIWVIVFGSKSIYDLWQNRQKGVQFRIKPSVIVNVVLAISVLVLSTALLFLLKPPAPETVYPPDHWRLVLEDSLNANNGYWEEGTTSQGGSCSFAGDVYRISAPKSATDCFLTKYDVTNFTFEVQMTLIKGDLGGIDFRYDKAAQSGYYFLLRQNGTYGLQIWNNDAISKVLFTSNSSAIHMGYNQPNLIAVVAQGNTFSLYANNQLLTTVTDNDSTYGFGKIGLDAYAYNNNPTEVIYSNAKIWEPSS